jgi:hypothetical protein
MISHVITCGLWGLRGLLCNAGAMSEMPLRMWQLQLSQKISVNFAEICEFILRLRVLGHEKCINMGGMSCQGPNARSSRDESCGQPLPAWSANGAWNAGPSTSSSAWREWLPTTGCRKFGWVQNLGIHLAIFGPCGVQGVIKWRFTFVVFSYFYILLLYFSLLFVFVGVDVQYHTLTNSDEHAFWGYPSNIIPPNHQ